MLRIPCFKVKGSMIKHDLRPALFVHLDGDMVELRREASRSLPALCTQLTVAEAHDLCAALTELLSSPPKDEKLD